MPDAGAPMTSGVSLAKAVKLTGLRNTRLSGSSGVSRNVRCAQVELIRQGRNGAFVAHHVTRQAGDRVDPLTVREMVAPAVAPAKVGRPR